MEAFCEANGSDVLKMISYLFDENEAFKTRVMQREHALIKNEKVVPIHES
jgi:hypothetical protein